MRRWWTIVFALFVLTAAACKTGPEENGGEATAEEPAGEQVSDESGEESAAAKAETESANTVVSVDAALEAEGVVALPEEAPEGLAQATFAGGCFWCMEPPFDELDGVEHTISGFIGGEEVNPTYKQVAHGRTAHTEAVRVYYDPDVVTYEELLAVFWRNHDPTDAGGQFVDRGSQYRPGVFHHSPEQKKLAEKTKKELGESGRFEDEIVTEITGAGTFWKAEKYHQNFYEKSPGRYDSYRKGSGRDQFLRKVWGSK